MRTRFLSVLSVLVLAGNMMLVAQENRFMSRQALDSLMSPRVMPKGDDVLRFEALMQDFGVIYEDDSPLAVEYRFVNVAEEPVPIRYASPHFSGLPAVEKSAVFGQEVRCSQLKKLCTLQRQSASIPSAAGSLVKV